MVVGSVALMSHLDLTKNGHCSRLQLPTEWLTSNSLNFQNPQARLHDLAAYTKAKKLGPRKEQVGLEPLLDLALTMQVMSLLSSAELTKPCKALTAVLPLQLLAMPLIGHI